MSLEPACQPLCSRTSNVERTIAKWSVNHYLADLQLLPNSASCALHVILSHDRMVSLETNQSVQQDDAVTELYHYLAKMSPCTSMTSRALYPNMAVAARPAYQFNSVAGLYVVFLFHERNMRIWVRSLIRIVCARFKARYG